MQRVCAALLVFALTSSLFGQQSAGPRAEYQEFQQAVDKMIGTGREVASGERELIELRTLQWLSRDLKKHVDADNWNQASDVKKRMQVAIQRSQTVVADAPRRKAEAERAVQERQHQELMAQRERQYQESMAQSARQHQAIMGQLRSSSAPSTPTIYAPPVPPTVISHGHKHQSQ